MFASLREALKPILKPVAICFVRAKVIGRSGGKSATAAAAYRSGEKIVDRATNKTHDYTKKAGIDHSEILTPVPATASNQWLIDRSALWNQVEASEKRYDAQLAREMIIAIPRELDRSEQINLVREHVKSSYVDRGMVADINLHHLDGDNPHAHVMLTMRELKIDDQGTVSFGNKDRTWNDKKLLETQIEEWEVVANQYLERAGVDTRIDSRSYEEQGISRIPQIHLGKNVTAMRRQGIPTERGDLYDQIERANQDIRQNLEKIYQAEGAIRNIEEARLDTKPYYPTAKEIETWYAAGNDSQQQQIAILFEDLKAAYMSEDFMQRKPYPGRIPNVYQSDAVAISLRTKQALDQIVIVAQAQVPVTNPPQLETVDGDSHTQEPSPDFERTRGDLESLARRPQEHDSSQRERRSQPGADSRPNREDRADRSQPHRDLGTDRRHRAASNLHPEAPQNRPEPAREQTRPTRAAGESDPNFAAIQAEFIELSNQVRDRGADPKHSPEGKRHPNVDRPRRVDSVRHDNVDGSYHQEQTRGANPAGTSSDPGISNPTKGERSGSSKNQKTESQKIKPLTKPQVTVRPRTDRDVTPTAGELRETYRQKSTFGDKIGLTEIEKLGKELNRIYQQTHPDREEAPGDFKHPSVWIDGKILEVSIPVTIKIDPEPESQKREIDRDYGMSM
jgi:MobA/MobL family